ncbi:MAG: outer membrane beta-barrel protein [Alphaproteobacteria bacterium]|nr:outer membrane beta-barrel protein [Alphaproteobacteria bacterium]
MRMHRLARPATLCLMFAGSFAAAAPSWSLDASNPSGLITETVARREMLRDYDGAKQYGAERVGDRSRAHVQPIGIRAGNFILFPALDTRVFYDDNIFGSSGPKTDDIRTELAPAIVFKSHLPRHILNFALDGRLVSFAENSDQNFIDGRAAFDGALHVDHAHTLALSAETRLSHEERDELSASRFAAQPTPIHNTKVSVGLTRDVGRLYGTLSATAQHTDYFDVDAIGGGKLDQDTRDNDIFSSQLRTGYRFSPGFEAIGKLRLLRRLHTHDASDHLDSTGYEALAGLSMETSPLLRWKLLGGYGLRDYDDAATDNLGTALLEGEVQWLPTQRMTLYATIGREFTDNTADGFSGWVETSVKGRMEYEIYNNIVLKAGIGFTQADFQGQNRKDDIITGDVGIEYYMNKNWLFTFSYEYQNRQSDVNFYDMERNRFMIGAKLRF